MHFGYFQSRLLHLVRERVRSGELTERGLARMTGVSQPHMHNILKGVRALSPEFGDELLQHLGLTLMDLCAPHELRKPSGQASLFAAEAVPVFRARAGPTLFPPCPELPEGMYPFPRIQLAPLSNPVSVILGRDDSMTPKFEEGDMVLLDRSEQVLREPIAQACYVVDLPDGVVARYIRRGGKSLYLATEASLGDPREWDYHSLKDRNILEIVRGRIVWIGRQVEPFPAEPARKAG